jgi:hypothetical protein
MPRLVRHTGEMEFRARLEALPKKAIKNRRRRRAVEASVMKAQSNFCRFRHSPPSPLLPAERKSRWKALKDGRDRQECQVEKECGIFRWPRGKGSGMDLAGQKSDERRVIPVSGAQFVTLAQLEIRGIETG